MALEFSQQIFEKLSNIKFNLNPSSGSRVVPCGRKDMTKQSLFAILRTRLKKREFCEMIWASNGKKKE